MSDTLYERYIASGDNLLGIDDKRYFAQGFTVGNTGANTNHNVTSVKLRLRKVGTPGMFIVSIRATDGAGLPTGADLTSALYDGDTLGTTVAWIEITLPSYSLKPNTTYAVVVGAPDCPLGSLIEWSRADTATYDGGLWCYSDDYGVSWGSNPARDFQFEEYGIPIVMVITAKQSNAKITAKQNNKDKLKVKQSNETKLRGKQINK